MNDVAGSQKQAAVDQHSRQAEEFAERYRGMEAVAKPTCFTYSRKRLDALLNRLLPEKGDHRRLLDIGCGTGHHMASFRQRGFEVAGVDGSPDMLNHARALNPGSEIHQADVDRLPFADGSFDYIVCVEVLRYVPEWSACLREMARVLKPGGISLATAAPVFSLNGYALVNRLALIAPAGKLVRLKQFFTTSGSLRRHFRAAGFATVDVHGVYSGPINWIERLAPWALPPVLKAWEPIDRRAADAGPLRELSNMFLVEACKADH
jgi:ubiquinone/menaquinone biosynthesis C-methylase UbiE